MFAAKMSTAHSNQKYSLKPQQIAFDQNKMYTIGITLAKKHIQESYSPLARTTKKIPWLAQQGKSLFCIESTINVLFFLN
jgi:glycine cleavage system H lipoate-binding protein